MVANSSVVLGNVELDMTIDRYSQNRLERSTVSYYDNSKNSKGPAPGRAFEKTAQADDFGTPSAAVASPKSMNDPHSHDS